MVATPVRLCQSIVLATRDITDWMLVKREDFKESEAADGELRFQERNRMTDGTGRQFWEFMSRTTRKRKKSLGQTCPRHNTTAWVDLDAACCHRRWLPAPRELRNRYQCLMSSCQRQHRGFRNIPPNDQRGEQGAQTKGHNVYLFVGVALTGEAGAGDVGLTGTAKRSHA